MGRAYDLVGYKFGKINILEKSEEKISFPYEDDGWDEQVWWKCRCDCGLTMTVNQELILDGEESLCPVCSYDERKVSTTINSLFNIYSVGARKRDLCFYLDENEFFELITSNCHYCGKTPSNKAHIPNRKYPDFLYNGIDRMDNSRGYFGENVVTCCETCNRAKGVLNYDVFLQWVNKVFSHFENRDPCFLETGNLPSERDINSAANNLYGRYKARATSRGRGFKLSKNEFFTLTKGNCFYCGIEPSQVQKTSGKTPKVYIYNGVDRVDNSMGYEGGNCVPCCKDCNSAKGTKTFEEFYGWIKEVHSYSCEEEFINLSDRSLDLAKKLQSFLLLKFKTSRLKNSNYDLQIDLDEAKERGEIIRMGDSSLLDVIRRIKGIHFDPDELSRLEKEEKIIKRKPNSPENSEKLIDIREKIDEILFVPELISIKVENKKHYERIAKWGLLINGNKFVRFVTGAGNLRRNTAILIDERFYPEVRKILDNGHDKNVPINPGKYIAYDALCLSSGHKCSFPNFTVVKDYIYERTAKVTWIGQDDSIEEKETSIKLNCFDGQGLMSPILAEKWGKELELGYIPSTAIIRAPYLKGQVVTFDFHEYCRLNKQRIVEDIYGNEVDLLFVDLIVSESMFKMASSYKSVDEYISNCHENGLGFYISRVSYEESKKYVWGNYMFMQVLDLTDEDIENICHDTVEYFNDLLGGDWRKMILYLGEGVFSHQFCEDWFSRIDNVTKSIIIEPELMSRDPYVLEYFYRSLSKKIRESYMGKLLFEGNFSSLVADPWMQCETLFNDNPKSLLSENGNYSKFWNQRRQSIVPVCRSPLTHPSEMVIGSLENSKDMDVWYKYQHTSWIYNPTSLLSLYLADSDVDGDLASSFNSPEIIKGKIEGLPISYDKNVAKKEIIKNDYLYETDIQGYDSKVGYYTNLGSSYYSLLEKFERGSVEYNEIQDRLIKVRRAQGEAIDRAKNAGVAYLIPSYWTKYTKIKEGMTDEQIEQAELNNKILVDKRPAYMRFLYKSYGKKYKQERESFDVACWQKFGISLDELIEKENKNDEEENFLEYFERKSFFIHFDGTMNRISNYMQKKIKEVRKEHDKEIFDHRLLLSKDFDGVDNEKLDKMMKAFREYRNIKSGVAKRKDLDIYKNMGDVTSLIRRYAISEISSNGSELADLAVVVSYGLLKNSSGRSFVWNVFGDELVNNLLDKSEKDSFEIPVPSPLGKIKYLYNKYEMREHKIVESKKGLGKSS